MTRMEVDVITTTEDATRRIGAELFEKLDGSGVVALVGELGAGKTCLTRGLCEAAGIDPAVVASPTFSLVREYAAGGGRRVCHFDFYRLEHEAELWEIGWQEYLDGEGILVVEWADRFPEVFPEDTHWVELEHDEEGRRVRIRSNQATKEESL